ncbi:MAG: ABC transporter E family member 2 [Terrestrivirus sp.]|uniref:ABC transporter E family member 2 n=1 Tax=Terrestrivirus sp. TaxID=2487775 RepID=A0A3G4ZSE8_9VIRU|nr:MAG: ABC transporter E family member 2 [Terrestrivirus sp.]
MAQRYKRVPIIDKDRCKPDRCNFECGLICPQNKAGKECITLADIEDVAKALTLKPDGTFKRKRIAKINEDICSSCGLCANQKRGCPFSAVQLVNVPTELDGTGIHRYGENGFRIYRMPVLKPNCVTGLLGQNGIGKSTIVSILSNKMKPNFEVQNKILPDNEIISRFKGSEMHKYMTKLYNNELKVSLKPQHVDALISYLKAKKMDPTVSEYLESKSEYKYDLNTNQGNDEDSQWFKRVITELELDKIANSKVLTLSGGELQRLVCATTLLTKADVYIFDEPTNYLDIRKRLDMAHLINNLVKPDVYVLVIEHDLTILDYMSEYVCIMYGTPGAFGIVSIPMSTPNAINTYFEGYIAGENMRFRESEYNLMGLNVPENDTIINEYQMEYRGGQVIFDNFHLEIKDGSVPMKSSITVILGENGSGKTTFINHLVKELDISVSFKPQYLSIDKFINKDGTYPTVRDFLLNNIRSMCIEPMFISDVIKPMNMEKIYDRTLNELSGGELQRFFITYCLGANTHIYLIDEPSGMLDIEQRVIVAKVLKRFAVHYGKILFVVEHDMMIAASLGSELNSQVVFMDTCVDHDTNKRKSIANKSVKFSEGINHFLKFLNVTFRTDSQMAKHKRPRINKLNSTKDREQKLSGKYYE